MKLATSGTIELRGKGYIWDGLKSGLMTCIIYYMKLATSGTIELRGKGYIWNGLKSGLMTGGLGLNPHLT